MNKTLKIGMNLYDPLLLLFSHPVQMELESHWVPVGCIAWCERGLLLTTLCRIVITLLASREEIGEYFNSRIPWLDGTGQKYHVKRNGGWEDPAGLGGKADESIWIGDLVKLVNSFLWMCNILLVRLGATMRYMYSMHSLPCQSLPRSQKRTVLGDKSTEVLYGLLPHQKKYEETEA